MADGSTLKAHPSEDERETWRLHAGDKLITEDGECYTIQPGIPGFGGSGIVYPARRTNSMLWFAIKECFPVSNHCDVIVRWERENGVIRPKASPGTEEHLKDVQAQLHAAFEQEQEISQEISNHTAQVIEIYDRLKIREITVKGQNYSVDNGDFAPEEPLYLLMQYQTDFQGEAGRGLFLPQLLEEIAKNPNPAFPLRTGGRPSVLTTVQIIREVVGALKNVHDAGWLYGDIQPGNILFQDPDLPHGKIGRCCFPDLGCARKLEADGMTASIGSTPVFTTSGYTPPELFGIGPEEKMPTHLEALRLTPAADLYSAGRLFHALLTGRNYQGEMEKHFYRASSARDVFSKEALCTPDCFRRLRRLLTRMLETDYTRRAQTAEELLYGENGFDALCARLSPPMWQVSLALPTWNGDRVLGREADLENIMQELNTADSEKPLFLTGFYGMGKSTLAVRLGQLWKQKYPDAQVFWAFFPEDGGLPTLLGDTMSRAISTVQRENSDGEIFPQEKLCDDVLDQLGKYMRADDLLIVDNVDSETLTLPELLYGTEEECRKARWKRKLYNRFRALPPHILFTTRMNVTNEKEFHCYQVGQLSKSALRTLIRSYYTGVCTDEELDALIELVEYHTMTVDMVARTMRDSGFSPKKMLEKLSQPGGYNDKAFVRIPGERLEADCAYRSRIEGHLLRLFQIQNLPEKERAILRDTLLIGPSGMPRGLFWKLSPAIDEENGEDKEAFQHLVELGYIRESPAVGKEPLLQIHTLVRVVGQKEVPPTEEDIQAFLQKIPTYTHFVDDYEDERYPDCYAESYLKAWELGGDERSHDLVRAFSLASSSLSWQEYGVEIRHMRVYSAGPGSRTRYPKPDAKKDDSLLTRLEEVLSLYYRVMKQFDQLDLKQRADVRKATEKLFDFIEDKSLDELQEWALNEETVRTFMSACFSEKVNLSASITDLEKKKWNQMRYQMGENIVQMIEQASPIDYGELLAYSNRMCYFKGPDTLRYDEKAMDAEKHMIDLVSLNTEEDCCTKARWYISVAKRYHVRGDQTNAIEYMQKANSVIRLCFKNTYLWSSDQYFHIPNEFCQTMLLESGSEKDAIESVLNDITLVEGFSDMEKVFAYINAHIKAFWIWNDAFNRFSPMSIKEIVRVPYLRAHAIYQSLNQPELAIQCCNRGEKIGKSINDMYWKKVAQERKKGKTEEDVETLAEFR